MLEGAGTGGTPLRVAFPNEPQEHARELLKTLGAVVEVDPSAPILTTLKPWSGRTNKTRSQLSDEERRRLQEAYYARPLEKRPAGRKRGQ